MQRRDAQPPHFRPGEVSIYQQQDVGPTRCDIEIRDLKFLGQTQESDL
jgi:hypothetical protein